MDAADHLAETKTKDLIRTFNPKRLKKEIIDGNNLALSVEDRQQAANGFQYSINNSVGRCQGNIPLRPALSEPAKWVFSIHPPRSSCKTALVSLFCITKLLSFTNNNHMEI